MPVIRTAEGLVPGRDISSIGEENHRPLRELMLSDDQPTDISHLIVSPAEVPRITSTDQDGQLTIGALLRAARAGANGGAQA